MCKDVHNEHDNVLNLVFRLIMPEVLTFLAVLFTRFWPTSIVSTLQATEVRQLTKVSGALRCLELECTSCAAPEAATNGLLRQNALPYLLRPTSLLQRERHCWFVTYCVNISAQGAQLDS